MSESSPDDKYWKGYWKGYAKGKEDTLKQCLPPNASYNQGFVDGAKFATIGIAALTIIITVASQ